MSRPFQTASRFGSTLLFAIFVLPLLQGSSAYANTGPDHARLPFGEESAAGALTSAWGRLTQTEGYRFKTHVSHERRPAPLLGNVGRRTKVDRLYVEGDVDKVNKQVHLWMWNGVDAAGSAAGSASDGGVGTDRKDQALEVKIEGDRAFGRAGQGEWKEVDNIGALVAPGMDAAAYLVGARDVSALGRETRDLPTVAGGTRSLSFLKYHFVLDGAALSEYTSAQISAMLKSRGELPPGLGLKTGDAFNDADGQGELWVDADGLPSRLKINLEFPEEVSGERVMAEIVTDFSDAKAAATTPALLLSRVLVGMTAAIGAIRWDWAVLALVVLATFAGLVLLVIARTRRTRRMLLAQQVIALAVIVQMLLSPVATLVQAEGMSWRTNDELPGQRIAPTHGVEAAPPDRSVGRKFNTAISPFTQGEERRAADEALAAKTEALAQLADESGTSAVKGLTEGAAAGKEGAAAGTAVASSPDGAAPMVPNGPSALAQGGAVDGDKDGITDTLEAAWGTDPAKPDTDGDGLKDGQEAELCAVPQPTLSPDEGVTCAHPRLADTDGDGLTDGQEYLTLGTYTNAKDTDQDSIYDKAEAEGFGDPKRYTDPRSTDTDDDGLPDGAECPERTREKATPTACRDTDRDGEPDVFDDDSDADGFFDGVDSAPARSMGTLGAPQFNGAKPFSLAVRNVEAGRKLLVDFQVRPITDRLAYPTTVLDWPTGDTAGQVQRRLDSTFADVWKSPDPALANGDLRVVPMLELTMDSDSAPLPRTNATLAISLVAQTPLGNVQLYDNEADGAVDIRLTSLDKAGGEAFSLTVAGGTCQSNTPVQTFTNVDAQQTYRLPGTRLAAIGDGAHVLVLGNGSEAPLCEPIGVAPENSRSLPFFFQRRPRAIGDATFAQAGSAISVTFGFQNAASSYDVDVRNGTCGDRGASALRVTTMSGAAVSRLVDGQFLTSVANGRSIIAVKESAGGQPPREVLCQPMPNLVNGRASQTTMIDEGFLKSFNVTVHEADANGKLIAYVPATVVTDPRSGRTAGLGGRMAFDTSAGTSLSADVRLVWQVQALVDFCADPPSDFLPGAASQERLAAWCGGGANQLQIVHQYADDGWSLAGLTVREERSLQVATVFEDPARDNDVDNDDRLWHLADGLTDAFLGGRDCAAGTNPGDCKAAGDGVRDMTARDVYERFRQGAPALPVGDKASKWGLVDGVLDARWFTKDSSIGIGEIVETDLPRLLDEKFLDASGQPRAAAPLVLFAAEETFRATELDQPAHGAAIGDGLTVDFAAGTPLQPVTVTTLNWKPYQRVQAAGGLWRWQAYPLAAYWDLLEKRLAAAPAFDSRTEEDGDLILAARTRMAQVYFTSLYGGNGNLVQIGNQVLHPQPADSVSDAARAARLEEVQGQAEYAEAGELVLATLNPLISSLAKQYVAYTQVMKPLARRFNVPLAKFGAKDVLRLIGQTIKSKTKSNWGNFMGDAVQSRGIKGKSGVRVGALVAGLSIASLALGQREDKVTAGTVVAATLEVISVATNIQSLVGTVETATEAGASVVVAQGATSAAYISKTAGQITGAVALLIGELVSWGAICYTIGTARLAAFGLAANEIAASGVADTIVAVGLLALAFTGPLGAVAAAVIGLIDSMITLTCRFIPAKMIEEKKGLEYFCKGLTGLASEAVAYVIYDNQDMVTISDPHRLQLTRFSPALKDPQTGFITDQPVAVDLRLVNTLEVSKVPSTIGGLYAWQYTEDALKSSAFAYAIVTAQEEDDSKELHNDVKRDSQTAEWQRVTTLATDTRHSIDRSVSAPGGVTTSPAPGLNRPASALLAEGYAIPVQECVMLVVPFGVIPVPVPTCWVRERRDTNYIDLGISFDVFPPKLDDFMALSAVGGGQYAPAWGQDGELKLPPLKDADGDGLPASIDGDDARWDTDGDLIGDHTEALRGSLANSKDSDGDGLADWQELRRQTDPLRPDSDGDGLYDGAEVSGWELVYAASPRLASWVRSDPLRPDADDDGLVDSQEKVFGFNPYVVSDRNALEFETGVAEPYAPDLILALDEPKGATAYQNDADRLGETTIVCRADKPVGYNAFIRSYAVDRGSNPAGNELRLAVNGVPSAKPIRDFFASELLAMETIPIATAAQPKTTPVHLTLTHSGGLVFTATSPELTIGGHEQAPGPKVATFNGPNGAVVSVTYWVLYEDGHCPTSGFGGYYGNAVKFDGAGDALVVRGNDTLSNLSRHFVASAWVRPDSVDPAKGAQAVLSTYSAANTRPWLELGIVGSELYASIGKPGGTTALTSTGASLIAGRWNYVRWEMDSPNWASGNAALRLVAGATVYGSQDLSGLPAKIGAADALVIGGRTDARGEMVRTFGGMLDEIVVTAMPQGSPLAAAAAGLADARYNPDDGLFTRNQPVSVHVGLGSKLLNREMRGYHTIDFPQAVFNVPDAQTDLYLPPAQPPSRVFDGQLTVRPDAPAGPSALYQTVAAAVTIPASDLWADPLAGEVFTWNDSQDFDGQTSVDFPDKQLPLGGDFTLSAWVKPGAAQRQRRGLLGKSSHKATGAPSLEIEDNALVFGYGDGSTWREAKSPQTLAQGQWNFVAVTFKRNASSGNATFYVNATEAGSGRDVAFTGVPATTGGGLLIGRSSNEATLTISKIKVTCEYDWGSEGEYDVLRHDGDTTGTIVNFVGTDNTEKTGPWVLPFTGSTSIEMCEDDNNNRNDCAGGDELMGKISVSANEVFAPKTATLSTRPEDPSCTYSFGYGWPETADVSYTLDNPSLPFIGGIQKVRIFDRLKTQSEVDALRRGATYVADFRFDEFPGSRTFKDFSAFHEATCNWNGAQCPQSGITGRDEQAVKFDGTNDYLVADSVSTAAAGLAGFTFGAWVKKERVAGDDVVLAFNAADGANRNMLLTRPDGPNGFTFAYYDDSVGLVQAVQKPQGVLLFNHWYHLAVTIDGANQGTLWLDSQPVATFTTSVRPASGGRFSIGQAWSGSAASKFFEGWIDRAFVTRAPFNDVQVEIEKNRAPFGNWAMEDDSPFLSLTGDAKVLPASGVRGDALRLSAGARATEAGFPTDFPFINKTSGVNFTVSIWVKGEAFKQAEGGVLEQALWAIGAEGASVRQLSLVIRDGVPQIRQREPIGQSGETSFLVAPQPLIPNVWQQITARHQSNEMSLFINGSLVISKSPWGNSSGSPAAPPSGMALGPFQGLVDEFQVYRSALTDREIREQFNRQNAWLEDQDSVGLAVSVDPPTVTLPITRSYFPQANTPVLIETKGSFAPAVKADLLIQGAVRAPATAVRDADPGSAFMATFVPVLGERDYTLQGRATDKVGNQSAWSTPANTIYVDGTAPRVAMNPITPQPVSLKRAPGDESRFVIPLGGTVTDPLLGSTSFPGSGTAFVEVTVYNAVSKLAVAPAQRAKVSGESWSLDYLVQADNLTGDYVVDAVAEDSVGNRSASIFATLGQVASRTVKIDTTAPLPKLGQVGGTMAQAARPGRDAKHAAPGDAAPAFQVGAPNAPAAAPPDWLGPDATLSGSVDESPASAVTSTSFAGVDSVDVAFRPLEAMGSAVRNAPLPASTLLYLPMDESSLKQGVDDTAFGDLISGKTAVCAGSQCPNAGAAGKSGQALDFDGVDDQLTAAEVGNITSKTSGFTLAAWVRPTATTAHRRILMTGDATGGNGFGFGLDGTQALLFTAFTVSDYYAPYDFAPNRWYHVAVAVDGAGNPSFFVNGRLVETKTAVGQIVADTDTNLVIGRDGDGTRFSGLIDEVAVVGEPLTGTQLVDLMGDGPALHIPFDERNLSGASDLADASGLGSIALRTSPVETEGAFKGIVGTSALTFSSSAGQTFTITPQPGTMPRGNEAHTIAGWFKIRPQGERRPSSLVVESGGTAYEQFDFYLDTAGAYAWAGSHPTGWVSSGFAANAWQHFASTYDGKTYTTWLNGVKSEQSAVNPFAIPADATIRLLNFEGAIDDLKVYRRALSAAEIRSLAATGWSGALLQARGAATKSTAWSASPPAGLEGYYQLDLRSTDTVGNYVSDPDFGSQWRGTVDTLAPRLVDSAFLAGSSSVTFTLAVEDFNLDLASLRLPGDCAADKRVTETRYQSPWYLALAESTAQQITDTVTAAALRNRSYAATIACRATYAVAGETYGICDRVGNCLERRYEGPSVGTPPTPTPSPTAARPTPGIPTATPRPPSPTAVIPTATSAAPRPTPALPTATSRVPSPTATIPTATPSPATGQRARIYLPVLSAGAIREGQ